MIIECANVWPESLPLPSINYAGKESVPTVVTGVSSLVFTSRQRFTKTYPTIQVQWSFTETQFRRFKNFFISTLGNGAAAFAIELRYPYNSTLMAWKVRFADECKAQYNDPLVWVVTGALELHQDIDILNRRLTQEDDFRITQEGDIRTYDL